MKDYVVSVRVQSVRKPLYVSGMALATGVCLLMTLTGG